MKRNFIILIGVIVILFAVSSCEKTVEQSDVYEITVELKSNADGTLAVATYNDLAGKFKSTDAVLVYAYVDDDAWMAMPGISYDGEYHYYEFNDDGGFLFMATPSSGYVWTGNFTMDYRIVRIPNIVFTEKKAEGVDHNNYSEVMKAYNLYEGNVIMKK